MILSTISIVSKPRIVAKFQTDRLRTFRQSNKKNEETNAG